MEEAVRIGNNLVPGRWSWWVMSKRWQNKATNFHCLRSKAQRDTRTHVSSVFTQWSASSPKIKLRKAKLNKKSEDDNLCFACCWAGLLDTAGVIFSLKKERKKRLQVIHSQLSCLFYKAPWQEQVKAKRSCGHVCGCVCTTGHTVPLYNLPSSQTLSLNSSTAFYTTLKYWVGAISTFPLTLSPFLGPQLTPCVGLCDVLIRQSVWWCTK